MIDKAKAFAMERHALQKYGDHPYHYHLNQVATAAEEYTKDPICQTVAWLHDILEDTITHYAEVEQMFGFVVAEAVEAITDKAGINREERHLNTYYRIRENDIALKVKLCDRLCNMRESFGKSIGEMYYKEYKAFKLCLYRPNNNMNLWYQLDEAYQKLKDMYE